MSLLDVGFFTLVSLLLILIAALKAEIRNIDVAMDLDNKAFAYLEELFQLARLEARLFVTGQILKIVESKDPDKSIIDYDFIDHETRLETFEDFLFLCHFSLDEVETILEMKKKIEDTTKTVS